MTQYTLLNVRGELIYVEGDVNYLDLNGRVAIVVEDSLTEIPEEEPSTHLSDLPRDVWKFVPDPDDLEWDDE
jgi:hypothetical protein